MAVIEAEAALLDRMPQSSDDALDLESLRLIDPPITKTAAKNAIKNLLAANKVDRRRSGNRGIRMEFSEPMESGCNSQPSG